MVNSLYIIISINAIMDHQECESVNKVRNRFRFSYSQLKTHKCFYRSMEVKLPALLGNYDRQTDQPI